MCFNRVFGIYSDPFCHCTYSFPYSNRNCFGNICIYQFTVLHLIVWIMSAVMLASCFTHLSTLSYPIQRFADLIEFKEVLHYRCTVPQNSKCNSWNRQLHVLKLREKFYSIPGENSILAYCTSVVNICFCIYKHFHHLKFSSCRS